MTTVTFVYIDGTTDVMRMPTIQASALVHHAREGATAFLIDEGVVYAHALRRITLEDDQ